MDAERVTVDHVNASSIGAPAYYDVPRDRPDSFVVVERTGGESGEGATERAMIDAQCWAPTRESAAALAERLKSSIRTMPGEVTDVAGYRISSTYRDRDIESGTPRYHVVFELYGNR